MGKTRPKQNGTNGLLNAKYTSPYFDVIKRNKVTAGEETTIKRNTVTIAEETSSELSTSHDHCQPTGIRLSFSFFDNPCVELAKALLGKFLVRRCQDGSVLKGCIVETESYLGGEDKASISYGGKVTEKSQPMYMKPGTTFVYLTYGMYNLINISSRGDGAAVLLRALEPVEGLDKMEMNRNAFQPNKLKAKKEYKAIPHYELCNGPAKLCISLDITKNKCNKQDLSTCYEMWVESGDDIPEEKIVKSSRIGINSAGPEWASKLLRFYILNNRCVSKRDKKQEDLLNATT